MYISPIAFWFTIAPREGAEWIAGYQMPVSTGKGGSKTAFVVLNDVRSEECPRSVLIRNPEIEQLIQMFSQEQVLKGMGDPAKWPGALYDSFLILADQLSVDKNARDQAVADLS